MKKVNMGKAAVIGCGFVGSTVAFTLLESGMFSELVLIDANHDRAEGEALDLSHGMVFAKPMKIYAGTYSDIADAAIIVMTAGANQKPGGETRLELVKRNAAIMKSVAEQLKDNDVAGTLIVVANPVDILTYIAMKYSGIPANKVIGSGTNLDTARFKHILGEKLNVDPRSVHAYIIGEHGDSEIAVYSSASVSGVPVKEFFALRGLDDYDVAKEKIAYDVKHVAYEVIDKKRATYYAIALSVKRIATAVLRNEHSLLPVSHMMNGEFGIEDVCMSLPSVIGENGVELRVPISLSQEESEKLLQSAKILKEVLADALS